ncbi:gamma-glutamyltransferase [Neorhizobium sp. Rsf11]|uniref:Gamma-glutamyltransferase n=2 Tax=Neorhizobium TaxID=1525371 RepID=A0ABV0MB37_9HYPH|nr:gamma-glutamyltransferase [Neorhizobium petrolearium]MCC2613815.1 gamma-glutamyltransferase [Neorhizobium petrolearium]WGI72124.1 gamma-glutamyltransferase [Neorhizobium petrolearium]
MSFANARTTRPLLLGSRHMVSAGHPLAAHAALIVLEAGGNAVDAGVAAGFALNVTQPDMANLGGVAPVLIHMSGRDLVTSIAGIGHWPALATLEAVKAAGNGRIPAAPQRWVVPGALDAWLKSLELYGTISAAEALAPAIDLARHGFPVYYFLRHNLIEAAPLWTGWSNAAVYMADGRVPEEGEPLRQVALAETLERLAAAEKAAGGSRENGIRAARDCFYRGEIAEIAGRFSQEVGGFLRASDMAAYEAAEEPVLSVTYHGRCFYGCGPWSQGPAVLQMLKMAERYDIAVLPEAELHHLLIEIAERALHERNRYYGDPRINEIDTEWLLSDAHAAELTGGLDAYHRAADNDALPRPGRRSPDTTYVCVVDRHGNAFSATPSDSTILVTPMIPGLGFGLSDRGLQASLDPANPNAVAPGKRPRLTPNPGLMMGPEGLMVYGTPGGEVQTQAMLQFLMHHLHRGADLQAAVETPRWASYGVPATEDPHSARPGLVYVEEPLINKVGPRLKDLGHDPKPWPRLAALSGGICAIRRDAGTGVLSGAGDPRRMSYAMGR